MHSDVTDLSFLARCCNKFSHKLFFSLTNLCALLWRRRSEVEVIKTRAFISVEAALTCADHMNNVEGASGINNIDNTTTTMAT